MFFWGFLRFLCFFRADYCNSHASIVLWGSGKYIHASHIVVSQEDLDEITAWLLNRLRKVDAPFISADVAHEHFREAMARLRIPNGHALHGVLRLHAASALNYLRSPMLSRPDDNMERSLVARIEEYVAKYMSGRTFADVQDFFCGQMGMKRHLFVSRFAEAKRLWMEGGVVNGGRPSFSTEKSRALAELSDKMRASLATHPSISVTGLFANNRILCDSAGIASAHKLYGMLAAYAADSFSFPVYPYVAGHGDTVITDIKREIDNFLLEYGRPCDDERLLAVFAGERGWSESSVRNAFRNENILTYVKGKKVHRDVIGLDDAMEEQILELAKEEYDAARGRGELAACIEAVFDRSDCPELDVVVWSRRLLAEILHRSSRFLVLRGPQNGEVYVTVDNGDNIDCMGALWEAHLERFHRGAEKVDVFLDALWRKKYIPERNVSFIHRERRLQVSNGLVSLRQGARQGEESEEMYDDDD